MKKRLFKWLKVLLIIYCIVGIALYFFQEQLLLRPTALPADYKYSFGIAYKEVNIDYNASTKFNIIQFQPTYANAKVVLYFHGNKENINHYAVFAGNFTKQGYAVWMCDYPGYGKSTGIINEAILYKEALEVYKLASKEFMPENIVIYGKSLGTGIAAQLASTQPCKRLILETPYCNIASLAKRYAWMYPVSYFSKYKIPTTEYLKAMKVPISIFHGTEDGVIPYKHAIQLKAAIKATDEFITIPNGSHNNLNDFPLFHQKLDSLLVH